MSYTQKSLLLCPRKGCKVLRRTCQNVCLCSSLSARVCQFSVFSFELLVRIICTFGTTCTNYFSFLTPRTDLSLKCARQYYQIVFFNFILFSLFFSFSLHGALVRALRALLHPPRLLQVAYCTHCICILNCWVNRVK